MSDRRLERIRETVMSTPETRASAQNVVEAMLEAVADLEDGDPCPDWARGEALAAGDQQELRASSAAFADAPETVGELRERLRGTLTEIACRDA